MRVFEHDVFAGNLYLQMRNQKGGTPLRAARMQEHDVPPASEYQRQIAIVQSHFFVFFPNTAADSSATRGTVHTIPTLPAMHWIISIATKSVFISC